MSLSEVLSTNKSSILAAMGLYFFTLISTLSVVNPVVSSGTDVLESERHTIFEDEGTDGPEFDSEGKVFSAFYLRMREETARLRFNSNKNLLFGTVFSVIDFLVLSYFMLSFGDNGYNDLSYMIKFFLPRISIVLLIQFVGFFFLRLYVANELDLKHNKNEITNFEAKMIACIGSKDVENIDIKRSILDNLVRTERNFMIKKGEKTISIENLSEHNDLQVVLEKLIEKIPGAASGGQQ